jgi:hypothetical protein
MISTLLKNKDITPRQRDVVIAYTVVDPVKNSFGVLTFLLALNLGLVFIGLLAGLVTHVFFPESLNKMELNLIRFGAWFYMGISVFFFLLSIAESLVLFVSIPSRDEDICNADIPNIRSVFKYFIPRFKTRSVGASLSRFFFRIVHWLILLMLVLDGYILIPLVVVISWAVSWLFSKVKEFGIVSTVMKLQDDQAILLRDRG